MTSRLARLRVHLRLIEEGTAPVHARYAGQIQCKAGCSDCCHQTFRVSEIEGELLREGLSKLGEETRHDIEQRARRWNPDVRDPCPVLSQEGHCRLYDHRPRICRKYGIPLWHPDRPHEVTTCELNFRETKDIDAELVLDPQAGWAEDWITLRETLALGPTPNAPIAHHLVPTR